MKAVITGANSFIGRCLSDILAEKGWEVVQVIRRPFPSPKAKKQIYLSMEEYDQLGSKVGPCDCLIHLAWNGTRGSTRMNRELQQKNVQCSMLAIQSIQKVGCTRILSAGSQAEYGPWRDQITEKTECRPNTEYGKAKLDFYYQMANDCEKKGVAYKEPRFFSLYGPHDYEGTLIISTLKSMLRNEPCPLTQGIQMWDFLYLEDAVRALVGLCERDCENGVYNFGSGDIRPLKDYILEMASLTKTKSALLFGKIPYPETGMVSLWSDNTKLKKQISWEPHVSFAEGIKQVIKSLSI